MSKLHAQLALFGVIDEIVMRTSDPRIAAEIEKFLPGTTGPGQRGWYRELTRFISQDALLPKSADGNPQPRVGAVRMPNYTESLRLIHGDDVDGFPRIDDQDVATPTVLLNSLFATAVIGRLLSLSLIPASLKFPGWDPTIQPTEVILEVAAGEGTSPRTSEPPPMDNPIAPPGGPLPKQLTTEALVNLTGRAAFEELINDHPSIRRTAANDPLIGQVAATGVLRRVDGRWCSVLTTNVERPDITLDQLKKILDPQNWPKLCSFFVSMTPQQKREVDISRGWERVLETVSGDPTQWQLRTALRYWKGHSSTGDSIFVNYDLDLPRANDDNLVEVDSGYIWITPLKPGQGNSGVRIRTSKAVRIRGLSATATAALAGFFGWGDASNDMLIRNINKPIKGLIDFGPPVPDPGAVSQNAITDAQAAAALVAAAGGGQLLDAAENLEMLVGWRGALIQNLSKEADSFLETVARPLATDFVAKWSDGLTADDIRAFGATGGSTLTSYAVSAFGAAARALRSPSDDDTTAEKTP